VIARGVGRWLTRRLLPRGDGAGSDPIKVLFLQHGILSRRGDRDADITKRYAVARADSKKPGSKPCLRAPGSASWRARKGSY